jgi:uncharacterized protein with PIN domain
VAGRPPLPPLRIDRMLARLGRWLRLLGADAEPWTGTDEGALLALLRGEERTFLTRHHRRAARLAGFGLPVLLLEADDIGGQLRALVARYELPPPGLRFTRCGRCNEPLREAERGEAAAWVPPFVARTQDRFSRCPRCGRVYWRATQPERFARDLARLLDGG